MRSSFPAPSLYKPHIHWNQSIKQEWITAYTLYKLWFSGTFNVNIDLTLTKFSNNGGSKAVDLFVHDELPVGYCFFCNVLNTWMQLHMASFLFDASLGVSSFLFFARQKYLLKARSLFLNRYKNSMQTVITTVFCIHVGQVTDIHTGAYMNPKYHWL